MKQKQTTQSNNTALKRVILYLPLFAALLYLAMLCLRWSVSDIQATQVEYHLKTLKQASANKTVKAWRQAKQQLDSSLASRPENPQHLELAEYFYQVLDGLETEAPELMQELGWQNNEAQALNYARSALQIKPSWPYAWKQLVLSKSTLKQYDSEMSGGYAKAMELGKWEATVVVDLVDLGLRDWENLNAQTKHVVQQAIEQLISINQTKNKDSKPLLDSLNAAKACPEQQTQTELTLFSAYCNAAQAQKNPK